MQPALFIGHGSPMNVIAKNAYTEFLHRLAGELKKPRGILVVSAHWQRPATEILNLNHPPTIHDFFGFPCELYQIKYPAHGASFLVEEVGQRIPGLVRSTEWGFDHGAWAVLHHLFPRADVPVTQLSLNTKLNAEGHYQVGKTLRELRADNILILGSGNIVHNLREYDPQENAPIAPWAQEFDEIIAEALRNRDLETLLEFKGIPVNVIRRAVPTNEHYLPLLYTLGASFENETVSFPFEGFQNGSMSMRSVRFG